MDIFEFNDYKTLINTWVKSQPKAGHGQLRKMAQHLGVNSVVMSQVFRGDRQLNLEQALSLSRYVGLNDLENEYFLLLVLKERAGTEELRSLHSKQLKKVKESSRSLKERIRHHEFSQEAKAVFYSQWFYSAIRLSSSIPNLNAVTDFADYLELPRSTVTNALKFLIDQNLVESNKGKLSLGPQVTHIGEDSTMVDLHRRNWRVKALQSLEHKGKSNLFYSGPMVVSKKCASEIRSLLIQLIETSTQKAVDAKSEQLHCLNIDWFQLGAR